MTMEETKDKLRMVLERDQRSHNIYFAPEYLQFPFQAQQTH